MIGRIRAVQLSYTEAHTHLQQALRRAPSGTLAPGFFQTVNKFFVIVEVGSNNDLGIPVLLICRPKSAPDGRYS